MAEVIKKLKRGMPKRLAGTTTENGLVFTVDNLVIVLAPHELARIVAELPAANICSGLTMEEARDWLRITRKILTKG